MENCTCGEWGRRGGQDARGEMLVKGGHSDIPATFRFRSAVLAKDWRAFTYAEWLSTSGGRMGHGKAPFRDIFSVTCHQDSVLQQLKTKPLCEANICLSIEEYSGR